MNLKACEADGRGWSGLYFKISRTKGIKAIQDFAEARLEALRLIYYSCISPHSFPKYYGFKKVKVCGVTHWGIEMEHVAGNNCTRMSKPEFKTFIKPYLKMLKLKGIVLEDCYRENVILQDNDVVFIDVGSKFKNPNRKEIICKKGRNV